MKPRRTMSISLLGLLLVVSVQFQTTFSISLSELHHNGHRVYDDKTLRAALDTIRGRRRQQFYTTEDTSEDESFGLPSKRLKSDWDEAVRNIGLRKRQEEEVIEIPLEVSNGNAFLVDYEMPDEPLRPSFGQLYPKTSSVGRLASQRLAAKLSKLMEQKEDHNLDSMKKRVLVKRNYSSKKVSSKGKEDKLKEKIGEEKEMKMRMKMKQKRSQLHSVELKKMTTKSGHGKESIKFKEGKTNGNQSKPEQIEQKGISLTPLLNGVNQTKRDKVEIRKGKSKALEHKETPKVQKVHQRPALKSVMKRKGIPLKSLSELAEVAAMNGRSRTKPLRRRSDEKVMQELKVMLEETNGQEMRKKPLMRSFSKTKKRKRSTSDELKLDPNSEIQELTTGNVEDESELSDDDKNREEWLRDEYWRTFAEAFSMKRKRKREVDYTDYFEEADDDDDDQEDKNDGEIGNRFQINNELEDGKEGLINEISDNLDIGNEKEKGNSDTFLEEMEEKVLEFRKTNSNDENQNRTLDFETEDKQGTGKVEDNTGDISKQSKKKAEAEGVDDDDNDDEGLSLIGRETDDGFEKMMDEDGQREEEFKERPKVKRSLRKEFEKELDTEMETKDPPFEDNQIDEPEKFNDVDLKLEKIQSELINEALEIIEDTRAESEVRRNREKVGHRLDAAYDLEDMRRALKDLHQTMELIDKEPSGGDKGRGKGEEAETVEETSITLVPIQDDFQVHSKRSQKKCPALSLLTSDCSAIEDLISTQQLQRVFIETCNWHEVCYSCGQAFGLLSSECDTEFLEQNRVACKGSAACESASQLILGALRERRIFYKRKVPSMCYQQKCVRNSLLGTTSDN